MKINHLDLVSAIVTATVMQAAVYADGEGLESPIANHRPNPARAAAELARIQAQDAAEIRFIQVQPTNTDWSEFAVTWPPQVGQAPATHQQTTFTVVNGGASSRKNESLQSQETARPQVEIAHHDPVMAMFVVESGKIVDLEARRRSGQGSGRGGGMHNIMACRNFRG